MIRLAIGMVALAAALSAQPKGILRPKGIGVQKGARISQIEKFSHMSPEERKRAIEKLPPERQKQIERNVERYNQLSDEEKSRLSRRLDHFNNLSPADQRRTRELSREVAQMPGDRRVEVRREMTRLRRMTEEKRKDRLSSEQFKGKYSADERRVIEELTALTVE